VYIHVSILMYTYIEESTTSVAYIVGSYIERSLRVRKVGCSNTDRVKSKTEKLAHVPSLVVFTI